MGNQNSSVRDKNYDRRNPKIPKPPKDVRYFAELTSPKKYKKKMEKKERESFDFMDKKDIKQHFRRWRLDKFPEVIEFLFRFGHLKENEELRDELYTVLMAEDFVSMIRKAIEEDDEIDNLQLFPVIAYDIIRLTEMYDEKAKKENPNHERYDLDDLIDLVKVINKKKIKRLVKKGFDESLAFDLMCVFPVPEMIRKANTMYRIRMIFQIMYAHAKTESFNVEKLFNALFKKSQLPLVVKFAMLERKEKYVNFTDTQKEVFNAISVWAFKTLEAMDKEDIAIMLKGYFDVRKRDKASNKDSARRFFIGSLPEDEYPRITSVVNKMKQNDQTIEEFL